MLARALGSAPASAPVSSLMSWGAAGRRAGAVSMEETGLTRRAPAPFQPDRARSFAHRSSACGMMQRGATCRSRKCKPHESNEAHCMSRNARPPSPRIAIGAYRFAQFRLLFTLQFIVQFRSSSSSLNRPWLP